MKIAYLLEVNPYINSGIVKKINAQVKEWRKQGNEVYICVLWPRKKENEKVYLQGSFFSNTILDRLVPDGFVKTYLTKMGSISRIASYLKGINPDVLYARQNIWYPGLTGVLARYNTVLELNTVDFMEMEFYSTIKKKVYLFGKNRILGAVKGLVAVSPDILRFYEKYKKEYGLKSVVVSNGIKLADFHRKKKPVDGEKISLVFVGSKNMKWHGLNKVYRLAERLPECEFRIVGYEGKNYKNVSFYGWTNKEELEVIYTRSHFGIGSFDNHLVGKYVDSTLKVREYLAYGLPVILGHWDVDFRNSDFVFKATDKSGNLKNIRAIREFMQKYKDYTVSSEEIRIIESSVKEKERLEFFKEIVSN
ncbi:glycosyltransferase [Sinomicrobium soli]|uniref:glycosyltransferase n=1 Tax=Sinomicrobium sp. N-1-3-6 TaxID=2219864 RepID=UPI000DCCEABB|nr:glycosyltransferase [Sinomicrobium sp. N-1-3-6]RAV29406.1 hypothetical protein DN748_07830 [Sinomicrobium sp. N-1-3-6]